MTSRNEAKLGMYNAVLTHIEANGTITATVPAFETAAASLRTIYNNIIEAAQQEEQAIKGITLDKSAARIALCQEAANIAAAVFAFAAAASNNTLKEQVNYPVSKLLLTKDELLIPACNNIHDLANTNVAVLTPYGVTGARLTSFNVLISDYQEVIPTPRNAATSKAAVRTSLTNLFKQADEIFKTQLDKIAMQFKTSNIDFYNTYKQNRIILDAATSSTQVTGVITDSETNQPIANVKVQVVDQPYTATSNAIGEYTVKIPVPGTYNLAFTIIAGYNNKTQNGVSVTLGQSTTLNMQLVPLPS